MLYAAVGVDPAHVGVLDALLAELDVSSDKVTARPFDGETVVQALVPLSLATLPLIRTWIRQHFETKRNYRITCEGIEVAGYSADEAYDILRTLLDSRVEPRQE